jgi:hypothetical protein
MAFDEVGKQGDVDGFFTDVYFDQSVYGIYLTVTATFAIVFSAVRLVAYSGPLR